MEEQNSDIPRRADLLQEQLDNIFKRANTNPVFHTPAAIDGAIAGCLRFYPEDRKNELAEIFYAVLDNIYTKTIKEDRTDAYCNPLVSVEEGSIAHFPSMEMLMRVMMPLTWALELRWITPELKLSYDENMSAVSEPEAKLFVEILDFLLEIFPELRSEKTEEFVEYWRTFATDRASMHPETSEEKAVLQTVLERKRMEFQSRGAK